MLKTIYKKFSKIHLYMLYREEAEKLGVLDEWINVKNNFVLFLKPITARYIEYNYYIPYGLNYTNVRMKIDPKPLEVSEEYIDEKFIEYLLLKIPRTLRKQRKPILSDMVDRFTKSISDGYKYAFNILERIGYLYKIPIIVIGDDNIARLYDKWRSMVVRIQDKIYWVL